jgi:uncharacterized membrane protein YsdA (DUF1294 family)/cold shock CspA family protein
VRWNDEKGYGFIRPASGGGDVFVHARDFPFYQRRPKQGDRISYAEALDPRGRRQATTPKIQGLTSSNGALILLALWSSSLPYGALLLTGEIAGSLIAYSVAFYLFGSTLTFSAYMFDKHRAVQGDFRVPESTLHLLEFLGGWPAALAAQQIFRHKNRKTSYQVAFWLIVLSHFAIAALLITGNVPSSW